MKSPELLCRSCDAKDREIEYLRDMLNQAQDRLLAATNPAAYQVYRGAPVGGVTGGIGSVPGGTDPQGQNYVIVGGQHVSAEEYQAQLSRLEEQMSGRSSVNKSNGGEVL